MTINSRNYGAVSTYILVALILGAITYVEFALVEYPQAWLGRNWTLVWLVVLSVVKFVMVVMFFMHLKQDDKTYTGFFGSGMVLALGTFVGLTFLFILPRAVTSTRPPPPERTASVGHGAAELDHDVLDAIETDGRSRETAAAADSPPPADRTLEVEPPLAADGGFGLDAEQPEPPAEAAGQPPAEAAEPPAQPSEAEAPAAEPVVEAGTWDEAEGMQVYNSNCMACHQPTGQGIPGAFPPVAGHAAEVYAANGGRDYLIRALLFGVQGPIQVQGMAYNGLMPPWGHLSDAQIANVLNHVVSVLSPTAPSDFVPYQPGEVAAHRGDGLSSAAVHASRSELGLP